MKVDIVISLIKWLTAHSVSQIPALSQIFLISCLLMWVLIVCTVVFTSLMIKTVALPSVKLVIHEICRTLLAQSVVYKFLVMIPVSTTSAHFELITLAMAHIISD